MTAIIKIFRSVNLMEVLEKAVVLPAILTLMIMTNTELII